MGDEEQWRQLASDLGFEFKEGIRAFLESPSLQMMAAGDMTRGNVEQARKMLSHPMVQTLLAKMFMGVVAGRHRGIEFNLFRGSTNSGNSSKSYYVNVAALFKRDLGIDLEITGIGRFGRLMRKLFSGPHVKVPNNPEFERVVAVKARDKTQAAVFVSSREIQEKLLALFQGSRDFKVTDHGIRYKEKGRTIEKERALAIMDLIADAIEKFGA